MKTVPRTHIAQAPRPTGERQTPIAVQSSNHTLRPCSDEIRALKRQIIFPPTYNIHWNTRAAEEHAQRG